MPQCSYTLHRDSPNGPVLRYARVGDVVFHVWDCPSDVYAMLIHSCYILDGQGGEHQVVDDKGFMLNFLLVELLYNFGSDKCQNIIPLLNFMFSSENCFFVNRLY